MKRRGFSLIFGLFLLAGCANRGPATDTFPAQSLHEAVQTALAAKVYCSSTTCPDSVGMLSIATADGAHLCTASLVGSDTVLTASHCIPDELKASGSDCSGRMWMGFADGTQVECAKVVSATSLSSSEPSADYALLQLKTPLDRTPLKFSHAGFDDGATFTVAKIDPYSSPAGPIGYLTTAQCQAALGSLAMPNATTAAAPIIPFGGCEIVHGNSGAPMLDSENAIHGVVQAIFDDGAVQKTVSRFGKTDQELFPMSWATNLACAALPGDSTPQSLTCAAHTRSPREITELDLQNEIADALPRAIDAFQIDPDPRFGWKVRLDSFNRAVPIPTCVSFPEKFASASHEELKLPSLKVLTGFDAYLRPSAKIVQDSSTLPTTLSYDGSGNFTLKTDSGSTLFEGALAHCKNNP